VELSLQGAVWGLCVNKGQVLLPLLRQAHFIQGGQRMSSDNIVKRQEETSNDSIT
jgi:hypothetical protein